VAVLLFFTINFILFVFVLGYFAGPLARKFFADRAATIRNWPLARGARICQAQDLANKAAARMATLEAELKKTAAEIEEETAFQVTRVAELAKSTAERIRNDAVLSTAALAEAAKRRVRARLAETAATLARDLNRARVSARRPGAALSTASWSNSLVVHVQENRDEKARECGSLRACAARACRQGQQQV